MTRKTSRTAPDTIERWEPQEADQVELEQHVNALLDTRTAAGTVGEPRWFIDAFDASWRRVLADADSG